MSASTWLRDLGPVRFEPSCVVPDEPPESEVVRHAAPLDERARTQIREQQIARLRYDAVAVQAREARIAGRRGPATVRPFRRRA